MAKRKIYTWADYEKEMKQIRKSTASLVERKKRADRAFKKLSKYWYT